MQISKLYFVNRQKWHSNLIPNNLSDYIYLCIKVDKPKSLLIPCVDIKLSLKNVANILDPHFYFRVAFGKLF